MFFKYSKVCDRETVYEQYTDLKPLLLSRIDDYIKQFSNDENMYKAYALENLKRNIKYHFESEEIKALIISSDRDSSQLMHDITRIPLYIHMMSGILCLSFSTFFHLFCSCSEYANNYFSRLDYGGISFLIAGSCMPPYFYSFYCKDTITFAYVYSIVIYSICTAAFVVTMIPKFDQPKFRKFRAILYIAAGLSTSFPAIHLLMSENFYTYPFNAHLWALGGAIYIGGAILYALRIPERFFPMKFDYFGSSHNIFHFAVIIAAIVHFYAGLLNYHGRRVLMC
jgi:adiponectin receptor